MPGDVVWLERALVLALHERLLAVHGGPVGVRDEGLLDSALARPVHLAAYGAPDLYALAAAYAAGIVRNHPFVDGNKRTAFMAAYVFLGRNGGRLIAPEHAATRAMQALAAGDLKEEEFARWLRDNTESRP
ncbi:MAG: type II toxin-antitoxin system death-on-curing family toxin [Rhodospirillales bacterium]|nr:MAG: type II toxin-antitoxin system death-on-curing family toxin [Rhodospirillales bacterium]